MRFNSGLPGHRSGVHADDGHDDGRVLIIGGIVVLFRWLFGIDRQQRVEKQPALEILQQRYAKGEINKQEFEEKKKDLIS